MNGTIKPAEPEDNPGEIMVAMMPRAKDMPISMRLNAGKEISCPKCLQPCLPRFELIRSAAETYKGRCVVLCTECALKGHLDKESIPRWIQESRLNTSDIVKWILDQEAAK